MMGFIKSAFLLRRAQPTAAQMATAAAFGKKRLPPASRRLLRSQENWLASRPPVLGESDPDDMTVATIDGCRAVERTSRAHFDAYDHLPAPLRGVLQDASNNFDPASALGLWRDLKARGMSDAAAARHIRQSIRDQWRSWERRFFNEAA